MSIFSTILDKIFHHPSVAKTASPSPQAAAAPQPAVTSAALETAAPAAPAPQAPVDVEAVLTQMASDKGGGGNWQTSIVDLLKLLDIDASLDGRKQLAEELNVHVAPDGTAEENIALHKAVMQKLADNGGKVLDSLKGG